MKKIYIIMILAATHYLALYATAIGMVSTDGFIFRTPSFWHKFWEVVYSVLTFPLVFLVESHSADLGFMIYLIAMVNSILWAVVLYCGVRLIIRPKGSRVFIDRKPA
jgi:hypothetical protein